MTSTVPIFKQFLSNENSWKEKWVNYGKKPVQFNESSYRQELTPFYGMPFFETLTQSQKEKLFFEYIKLVSEAIILLEQVLIFGFYHFGCQKLKHEKIIQDSVDKLSLEELYHSQAYKDFLGSVPQLCWKENPIYPSHSLMRKLFAIVIKWAPLGMTLPGAKIEAFSLAYYRLLKRTYKDDADNSWIELNAYHHHDEAFHVPLEFDLYNSTIRRTGPIKTLISTIIFVGLFQYALVVASWRLVRNSFPEKSKRERVVLAAKFSKWAIRMMPAFEETRIHTKKLFKSKKPLFSNILSFMHW